MHLNHLKKKPLSELTDNEIFCIIQEEGYSPKTECNGDITFYESGKVFAFGKCTDGFVYARLYYELNPDDKWNAMLAAQYTEVSFMGIKVMLVPHKKLVLFSVESLCVDSDTFRLFIKLAMKILSDSVTRFYERMATLSVESDKNNTDKDGIEKMSKLLPAKTILS